MRILQAGVGGFGLTWVYAVRDCDGFEHVALVDPSADALRQAGDIAGVPAARRFTDLEEALASVQADGLIDATPAPCHEFTSVSGIQAGLHVLCEKPLSETMESAKTIVRAAERADRILMVTQQYRYNDQPRAIRKLIAEGAIGEIDHVAVEFQIQGLFFGWRQRMQQPLLMDMAVHHFDMMRFLLGRDAEEVTARTWNPDYSNTRGDMSAFAWIDFEGGVKVNYLGSFGSPGQDTGWNGRWVITGSRGSIVWNQRDDWGPVRIFHQNADLTQYTEMHFFTPLAEPWGEPYWAESIGATGHQFDLYHWRACIEKGIQPETSGCDNLSTLAIVFAAIESAATGRPVPVEHPKMC